MSTLFCDYFGFFYFWDAEEGKAAGAPGDVYPRGVCPDRRAWPGSRLQAAGRLDHASAETGGRFFVYIMEEK